MFCWTNIFSFFFNILGYFQSHAQFFMKNY